MWDAEDVVADAMVRWLGTDRSQVREPAAFLTTVVSRLALDQLRSARATRETYTGPWLPEPVIADETLDPLDSLVKRDTLSLATLRLMEQLTPPERAVFVLREAFDIPYAQIAEILDVSESNARQLLHRAQTRLGERRRRTEADESQAAELLERLLWAAGEGKLQELEEMLADDVVSYNDGGGRARAALVPVVGRKKIMAFMGGLRRRFGPSPTPGSSGSTASRPPSSRWAARMRWPRSRSATARSSRSSPCSTRTSCPTCTGRPAGRRWPRPGSRPRRRRRSGGLGVELLAEPRRLILLDGLGLGLSQRPRRGQDDRGDDDRGDDQTGSDGQGQVQPAGDRVRRARAGGQDVLGPARRQRRQHSQTQRAAHLHRGVDQPGGQARLVGLGARHGDRHQRREAESRADAQQQHHRQQARHVVGVHRARRRRAAGRRPSAPAPAAASPAARSSC